MTKNSLRIDIGNMDKMNMSNFVMKIRNLKLSEDIETVEFDLRRTNRVRLFAGLVMCQAMKDSAFIYKGNGITHQLINRGLTEGSRYADSLKLYDFVGLKDKTIKHIETGINPTSNFLPITKLTIDYFRSLSIESGKDINDEITNYSLSLANSISPSGSKEAKESITFLIREIIRNVFEHANTGELFIAFQVQPYNDRLEVAILDKGCGIAASLSSNSLFKNAPTLPKNAMKHVMSPGGSRAYKNEAIMIHKETSWENSGYGLFLASRLCARLSGSFSLISSDILYELKFENETNSYVENMTDIPFKGCAVQLEFKLSDIYRYDETLAIILDEAKNMEKRKNTFSDPSRYSYGKIND